MARSSDLAFLCFAYSVSFLHRYLVQLKLPYVLTQSPCPPFACTSHKWIIPLVRRYNLADGSFGGVVTATIWRIDSWSLTPIIGPRSKRGCNVWKEVLLNQCSRRLLSCALLGSQAGALLTLESANWSGDAGCIAKRVEFASWLPWNCPAAVVSQLPLLGWNGLFVGPVIQLRDFIRGRLQQLNT